ncbi:hypothetical protein FF38_08618 [Lucilia cuprina]|uniref:Uncharacterized protein n=1 Tax=Lucilia cuprina TaxID=7375 RepID=A0A0L0C2F7_LUCCU|nr:hypothetical protein FF38_08618 [Lucilia cuprina]
MDDANRDGTPLVSITQNVYTERFDVENLDLLIINVTMSMDIKYRIAFRDHLLEQLLLLNQLSSQDIVLATLSIRLGGALVRPLFKSSKDRPGSKLLSISYVFIFAKKKDAKRNICLIFYLLAFNSPTVFLPNHCLLLFSKDQLSHCHDNSLIQILKRYLTLPWKKKIIECVLNSMVYYKTGK